MHAPYLDNKEKMAWLRLIRSENVGPVNFHHLLHRFKTAQHALKRLPQMTLRAGRTQPLKIPSQDAIEQEYEKIQSQGIHLIAFPEDAYPERLRALHDAPPLLMAWGDLSWLKKDMFSIVGARNASALAHKVAFEFAQALGREAMVIVSGLAQGVDSAAHKGSLDTGTVAVLAQGIDHIYPPQNKELHRSIQDKGLLISESPLGTEAHATLFPRRNRLVSGLSWGVLVVEALLQSGSLLTAHYATEQGRSVFAIPGHPHDPRAGGPNSLIAQGAKLTQTPQDILEEYHHMKTHAISHVQEDAAAYDYVVSDHDVEAACHELTGMISATAVSIETLAHTLGMPLPLMQAALTELEIGGLITSDDRGHVYKKMHAA
ncbi:DNA-processing protein DprA [Candidatus Hepatobacter penaei]|uniref:DNA-processing protein DprA n=1 Tax=Candidatus Hepatobacter penaei TaxID=1274402 RepID=UPI000696002F|nr:DNA-processing protein DprA [Candidatus Hepatobacter penaei]TGW14694.1 DNA-protecting protein DprA [bacterium NHP-B]